MEREFGGFRAEAGTGSNIFGVRVHACTCTRGRLGYDPGPIDGFYPPQGHADTYLPSSLAAECLSFRLDGTPGLWGSLKDKHRFIFRHEDGAMWEADHQHVS